MPPSDSERRRAPRIPVRIPATVRFRDKPTVVKAEVLDISVGGAFIHCTAPIQLGQEIVLEIHYQETEVLEGKVVELEKLASDQLPRKTIEPSIVRWVRGSSHSGFGVQFVAMDREKENFVQRLRKYMREEDEKEE